VLAVTKAPPKHARGRHAKPPSEISVKWDRVMKARPGERHRRRLVAVGTGAASVALLGVAALTAISATAGTDGAPKAKVAARNSTPKAKPSTGASTGETGDENADPDEVTDAVPFLESKDPDKKIVSHVKDVRRSGPFLRVYTDYGEDDENSKPAKSLCEWTMQFLEDSGDSAPRVFIHGKSSDNGSVVLANKQSDKDDCGVEDTP
jgi:hypothetical protein